MRQACGLFATQIFREILHNVVESGMRAAAVEQIEQLLTKLFAVWIFDRHGRPP
jgi:hypothetical protein